AAPMLASRIAAPCMHCHNTEPCTVPQAARRGRLAGSRGLQKGISHCRKATYNAQSKCAAWGRQDGNNEAKGGDMPNNNRRAVLKGGAALAGAYALGFPGIARSQTDKIKIGHLTPLTGFLGALGAYAQLGLRMAEEEINASGGVMGRQLDIISEDS